MDDPICENINDLLLKANVRYRNHPSIVAINKFCNSKSHVSFKNAQKEEIRKGRIHCEIFLSEDFMKY